MMNESIELTNEDVKDTDWLRTLTLYVRCCFLPIIIVGTVTNILCFAILSQKVSQLAILLVLKVG